MWNETIITNCQYQRRELCILTSFIKWYQTKSHVYGAFGSIFHSEILLWEACVFRFSVWNNICSYYREHLAVYIQYMPILFFFDHIMLILMGLVVSLQTSCMIHFEMCMQVSYCWLYWWYAVNSYSRNSTPWCPLQYIVIMRVVAEQ